MVLRRFLLFRHRVKHWMPLLLLLAAVAYGIGRGCDPLDTERPTGGRERHPAGSTGATQGTASPGAGAGVKAAPLPQRLAAAEGTVVRVRDGDSIVVIRGGVGIEVRLDGIDCPELAQAFGMKAKSFISGRAFGKSVRLVGKGKDRYGRELAEVILPDGRSLNRELVAAGYAWWYRKYSTDSTLEALEQMARKARRGLWADPDPVAPWDFRVSNQRRPGGGS